MKKICKILLAGIFLISTEKSSGQANAYIQVLTLNSGNVNVGGVIDIQVTVGNTGPVSNINANNVRTQVSVPSAICSILPNAQQTGIPAGWVITSNNGVTIQLCNGSDVINPGQERNVLIKVQGNTVGGPSTVSGALFFRSGTNCSAPGSLPGNNTADDNSTSSITVQNSIPVKLSRFDLRITNCTPALSWTTENESNSLQFEIERRSPDSDWLKVGTISAAGNSNRPVNYQFADEQPIAHKIVNYRLKAVDRDGRFEYSQILSANLECDKGKLLVYPNPVNSGRIFINISGVRGYAEAKMIDLTGKMILSAKLFNGIGSVDVSSLPAGYYLVLVHDNSGVEKSKRVVIQK